jgi:hypothetical protein
MGMSAKIKVPWLVEMISRSEASIIASKNLLALEENSITGVSRST